MSSYKTRTDGHRQQFRLPRSISEQESILAHHGSIYPSNENGHPNEMRDLMDLRARGIFDDRDVTDLLAAIQRTQQALAGPRKKLQNRLPKVRHPNSQSKSIKQDSTLQIIPTTTHEKPSNSSMVFKTTPKLLSASKKMQGPAKRTNGSSENKVLIDNQSSSPQSKVIPGKQEFKQTSSTKTKIKQLSMIDKAQLSIAEKPSENPLSVIKVKASIVRSIDEIKSIISEMTQENFQFSKKQISSSVDRALESLSAAPKALKKQLTSNLSHSFKQIKLAIASMDPYDVPEMKEILVRHVIDAENIILPQPAKKPARPKSLARKIVEYAAKNPRDVNLMPLERTVKPNGKKEANTSPGKNLNSVIPNGASRITSKTSKERHSKSSTKSLENMPTNTLKEVSSKSSTDTPSKILKGALLKNAKSKKSGEEMSEVVHNDIEEKPEESFEPFATLVRCIERAKRNASVADLKNMAIVKEGVIRLMKDAMQALSALQDRFSSKDQKTLISYLERAKYLATTMTNQNLDKSAPEICAKLEEALDIVATSKSITLSKVLPRRKGLAMQIGEYVEKNPTVLENIESSEEVTKIKATPVISEAVITTERLEYAINSIRGDCRDQDLLLLASRINEKSKGRECNLRITVVDRKTTKIIGNFVISESNFISLAESGAFSKYYTARISTDLENLEEHLEFILRYINQPSTPAKMKQSFSPTPVFLKPPLHEHIPAVTSAAIRRSITISPRDQPTECVPESTVEIEPTIAELLMILKMGVASRKDLDLFFDLVEKNKFLIYAHPDFHDERCIYVCELFTWSNEYMGTTKLRGEDILEHLKKRPCILKHFEVIVDVTEVIFPFKFKDMVSVFIQKIGLMYLYDLIGVFVFNICKKWGLIKMKA